MKIIGFKKINTNKFYLTYLLLWFIPFTLYCQRYINGRIIDAEDGSPIPAATVFFTNTTVGATTDAEGYYRIRIPGEGSYQLTVSHVGYQSTVQDIEPEKISVQLDVAMKIKELEDVKVSAGIRFRQTDINHFWKTILGKNPSRRTIQAINPQTVYYYYNPETRILKVTCREPLQIVNNETGYHIHYVLDNFTHDYKTDITEWSYQYFFTELEPSNTRQKNTWDKNRMRVYNVSITKFIKSLYNNSLQEDGFVLATYYQNPGYIKNEVESNTFRMDPEPRNPTRFYVLNPDSILSTDSRYNSKVLDLSGQPVILICYGRPVTYYDVYRLQQSHGNALFANLLLGESIRVFSDGTYVNKLHMSPVNQSTTLLGLFMRLPIEYIPKEPLSQ